MEVKFNNKIYVKKGMDNNGLNILCYDIFKCYLDNEKNKSYKELKNIFNQLHCSSNMVLLNEKDWKNTTLDTQSRYFEPIEHNQEKLYFTTQWGNNGKKNHKDCNNINHVIDFALKKKLGVELIDRENVSITIKKKITHKTKNIMLYGAPGVGKTHNYKKLISQIEEGKTENEIFKSISENEEVINQYDEIFQNIKDDKRIEFVTFHQSYSYEDFIEGFRPNKDGKIELDKQGIFKNIADNAMKNLNNSYLDSDSLALEQTFEYFVKDCILHDEIKLSDSVYVSNIDDKAFYYTSYTNGMKNVKILFDDIKVMVNSNIKEQKEIKKLSNIMGTTKQRPNYPFAIYLRFLEFKDKMQTEIFDIFEKKVDQKNFYIVIDEINRGNISKIFGELITLIEEDKRAVGDKNDFEVTLPYSKEKFKIPSNLYIVATMNSTDKSIATIDIALRRRFTFLKMKPKSKLVKNDNARKLMDNLNKYIEDNIGEDFKLGHSYFMKIENDEDLDFVKEYKVKPLLEEYFYADDEKLTSVLKMLE